MLLVNSFFGRCAGAIVALVLLVGCKTERAPSGNVDENATATITTPSAAPAPAPAPAPTTTVSNTASPNGLAGETAIADNFDVNAWLIPGEAPHASPDTVGAFRFTCLSGQLLKDDPIVYPGQPGKSHLHAFFGNTGINANSTATSIATTGNSTCRGGTVNRTPVRR